MPLHRLLKRQLAKATDPDGVLDMDRLCQLVDEAYQESDRDRKRTDRANTLMNDEMSALNDALHRTMTKASEANAWFEAAMDNMAHGLCLFDRNKLLMVSNEKFATIYGLRPSQLQPGMHIDAIVELRKKQGTFFDLSPENYTQIMEERERSSARTVSIRRLQNGLEIEVVHQPLPAGGYLSTHTDVTERQTSERKILQLAHHDGLTGLPNRTQISAVLNSTIQSAAETGRMMAVLYLDLDGFKEINDTLGHRAGDEVLVTIAKRLVETAGHMGLAGRLSGDEFFIVVDQFDDLDELATLAKSICVACAKPMTIGQSETSLTTSIGIAVGPPTDQLSETLIQHADLALYRAKASQTEGFRFYDPQMDAEARENRQISADLHTAMARNQLKLHYQPQIDLRQNRIVGYEALLRWNHPELGNIHPMHFIQLAEETNQISEIGRWVLNTACAYATQWPGVEKIAVNLSPLQFRQQDIVAEVRDALTSSGLAPDRLELEITESVLINNPDRVIDIIKTLSADGVSFALDDFGTGFSSLSYLAKFPFQKIKIDKSFIRELGRKSEIAAIVGSIIGLGRSLDKIITAEGVEDETQHKMLMAAGCDQGQGYLYGRANPQILVDATDMRSVG